MCHTAIFIYFVIWVKVINFITLKTLFCWVKSRKFTCSLSSILQETQT